MHLDWAGDEIRIENLEVYAHHGVYPEETENGQIFYVNAVLYLDVQAAGMGDELEKTVNYGTVCRFINDWMHENTCQLLEAAAERLANALLGEFGLLQGMDLEIRKPHAPIRLPFGCVSVKIHRRWHRAFLALGSNLGSREAYLSGAVEALKNCPLVRVERVSEFRNTEAYGGVPQGDFLNGAMEIRTLLGPWELLDLLHRIENDAGRVRTVRWGPRTLDLDILFFDRLCVETEDLVIPHPDMENREFVLEPMKEIAPYLRHPATGKSISELLAERKDKKISSDLLKTPGQ